MAKVVKQADLAVMIKDLQRRIAVLENGPRLTASSLRTNGNSRLAIINAAGQTMVQLGDVASSTPGVNVSGIAAYRTDGTAGFACVNGAGTAQFGFVDDSNNNVMQTDETSGYGLEDPSLAVQLYPNLSSLMPASASGSSTPLWQGLIPCTHKYFDLAYQVAVSGGATATITLVVNGSVVGTQTSTSAGFVNKIFSNVVIGVPGTTTPKTAYAITLNVAITSGAGTATLGMQYCYLHGSLGL